MSKKVITLTNLSDQYFDKGVKENKKIQYKLGMFISDVRSTTVSLPVIFILDAGVSAMFKLDNIDNVTPDDGINTIITLGGKRYKKAVGTYTSRKEIFTNLVTGNNSVVLQYVPVSFVDVHVYRNGSLVNDYGINSNTITFVTSFGNSEGGVGGEEIAVLYKS